MGPALQATLQAQTGHMGAALMAPLEVNRLAQPPCWRRSGQCCPRMRGRRGWPGPRQGSCTGGRRRVGPSILPLLPLALRQETVPCFSLFLQSVRPGVPALCEGRLFRARHPPCDPDSFQLGSHSAVLSARVCTACFFGLRAGMAPPGLLTSFGLKPLILTRFEAAGWQLVRMVGVAPRMGALGGTPGQVRVAAPAS